MENKVTIDDPGAYSKPFVVTINATQTPGDEVMEYICAAGNYYRPPGNPSYRPSEK